MDRVKNVFLLSVALGFGSLLAGTCRWKGDANGNGSWATPGNWEDGTAPENVEIVGTNRRRFSFVQRETALDLVPNNGLALIFR